MKNTIRFFVIISLMFVGCQKKSSVEKLTSEGASLEAIHDKGVALVKAYNPEGLELLTHTSEQGFQRSLISLGEFYEDGIYVNKSYEQAYTYYEKAAAQEGELTSVAYYLLGYFNIEGLGREVNEEASFRWFKKSADMGYGIAQNELFYSYKNGYGVEVDFEKAKEYARKGGQSGVAMVQYDLGRMLLRGDLFEVDTVAARYWLAKAAQQNYSRAYTLLGKSYITVGQQLDRDLMKGVALLKKAEELGDNNARAILNSLVVSDNQDTLNLEQMVDYVQLLDTLFSTYDSLLDSSEQDAF